MAGSAPPVSAVARVGWRVRADVLSEHGQDFAWLRVPAKRLLREEQCIVDPKIEDAARSGDEGEGFDQVLVVAQNICRRTDGPFQVVSGYAVFEGEAVFFGHGEVRSEE